MLSNGISLIMQIWDVLVLSSINQFDLICSNMVAEKNGHPAEKDNSNFEKGQCWNLK